MFALHAPTLLAFNMLLSITTGALLIWLWLRDRNQIALASWGLARLCGSVAMPLLVLRGQVADGVSINLAIAIVCLGYALTWVGARQFEGRTTSPGLVVAGSAAWLLACEIPAFYTRLEVRTAFIGVVLATYLIAAAWEFQRGEAQRPLPSRRLLVALLSAMAAVYAVSGGLPLLFPISEDGGVLQTVTWFGLLFGFSISMLAGSAVLLVALTQEAAELRSTSALAAARDLANAANDQKTRFLARMSHELRTPLNGMLGLAQVLARDPEQGERQRRQAATLEEAGRHLLEILNEVLDLSRIEAGRLELSPSPIVLADFLRLTVALTQESASAKDIVLEQACAAGLPDVVLADPMRLRQILLNLLSNAVKFTPAGGKVLLAVASQPDDVLRFTVTDSGPGVPLSLRPHLFEDYTQGPGDDSLGGSGLGLPISWRLAEAMQGTLTHADGLGGLGSRFTLTVKLPEVVRSVAAPATAVAPQPLRVLVIDDVSLNRMTAKAMLEYAGHTVDLAKDGATALAMLTRGPLPDIILMDQMMPDMDGQTLTRRIRAMEGRVAQVPILAATARAQPEDVAACLDAGMDGHVAKPLELQGLLLAIARALAGTGVPA